MTENQSNKAQTTSIYPNNVNYDPVIGQPAIKQKWMLSADEKKILLKTRAKALAKEPHEKEIDTDYFEVVEFLLAHEKYGIESAYVSEVYPLNELTQMPCTPPFVLGIINVRGQIISIIDLKKFFDLPEKGLADFNKVIIIHNDGMKFGILADVILGVSNVKKNELQSSLPTLIGIRAKYLKGVTKERLIVINAENILSDKKIIVHEEI